MGFDPYLLFAGSPTAKWKSSRRAGQRTCGSDKGRRLELRRGK